MRRISKLFFPRLPWDQRRRRMNVIIITLLAVLGGSGIIFAAICLINRR